MQMLNLVDWLLGGKKEGISEQISVGDMNAWPPPSPISNSFCWQFTNSWAMFCIWLVILLWVMLVNTTMIQLVLLYIHSTATTVLVSFGHQQLLYLSASFEIFHVELCNFSWSILILMYDFSYCFAPFFLQLIIYAKLLTISGVIKFSDYIIRIYDILVSLQSQWCFNPELCFVDIKKT